MRFFGERKREKAVGKGGEEEKGLERKGTGVYSKGVMKKVWLVVAVCGLALGAPGGAVWGQVQEGDGEDEAEVREHSEAELRGEIGSARAAAELMARVRSGVPTQPLAMEADVRGLSAAGKTVARLRANVVYRPDRVDPLSRVATYAVLSEDGRTETATMRIGLPSGPSAAPTFAYECPPGQVAEPPDLYAPLGGTDLCWMELSFSFLFWASPRIVDVEVLRKRWACQVVELDAPKGLEMSGTNGWNKVRLWVTPSYGAVVQGVAYRGDVAVKRFEVESVSRVRKTYMVSDMLVRNLETGTRSRLKIGGLELLEPLYTPEEREMLETPVEW